MSEDSPFLVTTAAATPRPGIARFEATVSAPPLSEAVESISDDVPSPLSVIEAVAPSVDELSLMYWAMSERVVPPSAEFTSSSDTVCCAPAPTWSVKLPPSSGAAPVSAEALLTVNAPLSPLGSPEYVTAAPADSALIAAASPSRVLKPLPDPV